MALQVAKLLLYLDRCPLGSLQITKLTLSDFVLVRGTLVKLVDLDDLELGKKPCIDNSDCHFQGTNLGEFHLCNALVILSFSFLECIGLCFSTSLLGLFNVFTAYGFLILDLKIFCILYFYSRGRVDKRMWCLSLIQVDQIQFTTWTLWILTNEK